MNEWQHLQLITQKNEKPLFDPFSSLKAIASLELKQVNWPFLDESTKTIEDYRYTTKTKTDFLLFKNKNRIWMEAKKISL